LRESLSRSVDLPEPAATADLAGAIVRALPARPQGWMILLQGELGSGKSTLARAILRELGYHGAVPSPTYTLVEPYTLPEITVYHVDLYRIGDVAELEFLGWSDLEDGLRIVEWPERVPELLARGDLLVRLEYAGGGRRAALLGLSARGDECLARLPQQLAALSLSP
jgi:tRNA threonylcarbamoyladenosine biosynthesis protein TsaE